MILECENLAVCTFKPVIYPLANAVSHQDLGKMLDTGTVPHLRNDTRPPDPWQCGRDLPVRGSCIGGREKEGVTKHMPLEGQQHQLSVSYSNRHGDLTPFAPDAVQPQGQGTEGLTHISSHLIQLCRGVSKLF